MAADLQAKAEEIEELRPERLRSEDPEVTDQAITSW
jgi:hypothetical protein